MDSKMIRFLIQGIIETDKYTLEGIAYHTNIPFDVIYEAACGINNQLSITPWSKIAELYIQVRPKIAGLLTEKLLEIINKDKASLIKLLNEK